MNVPLSVDTRYIWLLFFTVGVIALYIKVWRVSIISVTPKEPPVVRHVIPFFGHLWGLMRHAHDYVNSLWSVKTLHSPMQVN